MENRYDYNLENVDQNKTCIIVGASIKNSLEFNYELKEMCALCDALHIRVVEVVCQYVDQINKRTYVGSGKVEEISLLSKNLNVDLVIFNDELSPAQLQNLSDSIDVEIWDRTMLILEIFKQRAMTKEACIQVELANLYYMLPRLVGARQNLSRTGGGSGAVSSKGLGETALELDRRHIEEKITKAKSELQKIVKERKTTRKLRLKSDIKTVAVVGYTNAGKSTTINTILEYSKDYSPLLSKEVFVKDMLFATLETSTRRLKLENNHEFLLTDTVGFVSKLPHHLIESFKSTLEEIKEADLIIHLIDASSPYLELQVNTTNNVLKELGVADIPTVYVYNKIDNLPNPLLLSVENNPSFLISNVTKEGLKELIDYMDETLYDSDVTCTLLLPYQRGDIFNQLMEKATISSYEYIDNGIKVVVTLSAHLYELYKEYETIL